MIKKKKGVASVLKVHMGYMPGFVPGFVPRPGPSAASDDNAGASGGSGPIIHVTSLEDRRSSLGDVQKNKQIDSSVNFNLPLSKHKKKKQIYIS